MKRSIAAAVMIAAVVAGGAARANTTIESKAYVAPTGDISNICPSVTAPGTPDVVSVGGACFNVTGMSRVHVLIDDAVSQRTAFKVRFYGPAGGIADRKAGCGDATYAVPADALLMRVFVGHTTDCPDGTNGGLGTVGFITVVKSASVNTI